jgi:hypothetical protein
MMIVLYIFFNLYLHPKCVLVSTLYVPILFMSFKIYIYVLPDIFLSPYERRIIFLYLPLLIGCVISYKPVETTFFFVFVYNKHITTKRIQKIKQNFISLEKKPPIRKRLIFFHFVFFFLVFALIKINEL